MVVVKHLRLVVVGAHGVGRAGGVAGLAAAARPEVRDQVVGVHYAEGPPKAALGQDARELVVAHARLAEAVERAGDVKAVAQVGGAEGGLSEKEWNGMEWKG